MESRAGQAQGTVPTAFPHSVVKVHRATIRFRGVFTEQPTLVKTLAVALANTPSSLALSFRMLAVDRAAGMAGRRSRAART